MWMRHGCAWVELAAIFVMKKRILIAGEDAQGFGAVVTFGLGPSLRTTLQLPHFVGVFELQINLAAMLMEDAFGDAPTESQPQQFGK